MPQPLMPKKVKLQCFCEDLQDRLELTPPKTCLSIIGDGDAKVGRQETPGVTGKSGLGVQNEAEQRLTEFCQENRIYNRTIYSYISELIIANTLLQLHKRQLYTWTSPNGQYEIRIITFFS